MTIISLNADNVNKIYAENELSTNGWEKRKEITKNPHGMPCLHPILPFDVKKLTIVEQY